MPIGCSRGGAGRGGLLSAQELGQFQRAERFLWAVRCHLHTIAGRAEERLTFDYQREIAERMHYADRAGTAPVERFMKHYFLHAKTVGDLTGVFLAHLDEKFARRGGRLGLPSLRRRPRMLNGFMLDRGRLAVRDEAFLVEDPVRLIEAFVLADAHGLEIHPIAMRAISRQAKLVDQAVRTDPRANALFLDLLTSLNTPELALRWMNEAGVFGRFIPDFGRVVAQMQFDMYHHYTVDEHTIRAIGLLSRIERGELRDDHKLATGIIKRIASRRVLYVAVLLHDIAKGRPGDHSQVGAEIARTLCPRLGLSPAETETVAWLVRWHLLMSSTAQKRDLSDPQTIQDFIDRVKSLERLRLLYVLTVVDIRAVGARHVEQLEGPAPHQRLRSRGGEIAARPQAAGPQGAGCGGEGGLGGGARLAGGRRLAPCRSARRQLLACRAAAGAVRTMPASWRRWSAGPPLVRSNWSHSPIAAPPW
jgi:[protein-PII] uridylyltransferase